MVVDLLMWKTANFESLNEPVESNNTICLDNSLVNKAGCNKFKKSLRLVNFRK